MFELHPRLNEDSFFIQNLELSQLRLINNATYPWVILVPMRENLVEITDLSESDRMILMQEISSISKRLKYLFKADKINIAIFGNQVSQLHIHIICRFKSDPIFPEPVWSDKNMSKYSQKPDEVINKILT